MNLLESLPTVIGTAAVAPALFVTVACDRRRRAPEPARQLLHLMSPEMARLRQMPTASSNVRVREQSGKHILVLSSSQCDPVRTQSCGRYARRASRQGAAAFAVAPTLLRDRFNYSAPSASSASLSRHMVRISTLLQRDLCRTLRLPQFLDARFEPCDVFVCPREGKLTKFKGLR